MFSEIFSESDHIEKVSRSLLVTDQEIRRCLSQSSFSVHDLVYLLSPAAKPYLEQLAQRSVMITRQRFGNVMQLFVPLYLSNECYNQCTYCGFSMEHDYERVTLNDEQIVKEAQYLSNKGFQHILLLTGESPKKVGVDYISHAISLIRPYFSSIGIEVQPLSLQGYTSLMESGMDSLTLYQETYHTETYSKVHVSGLKRNYGNRLNAVEHAAEAGVYKINIGALLGLYDWRFDALSLASHLHYLQKKYWKVKYGVSFPRIQEMYGKFLNHYPVSDSDLVQLICAFRCVFPDLTITLSTRESAEFRDQVIPLGVSMVSAESNTSPGGYTQCDAEEQFSIHDTRSLTDICEMLTTKQLEPMFKDWDREYVRG
ncbi:2-iminoacetate synthase ThiH [Candidatus Marinamargulisbacteria bacterium SCGC AG-343-D04]|nr:2-iminoacetate synthase ThiH [Candidatus Marinamargulisbacteria bacterium SCGC AG-343-D04]